MGPLSNFTSFLRKFVEGIGLVNEQVGKEIFESLQLEELQKLAWCIKPVPKTAERSPKASGAKRIGPSNINEVSVSQSVALLRYIYVTEVSQDNDQTNPTHTQWVMAKTKLHSNKGWQLLVLPLGWQRNIPSHCLLLLFHGAKLLE